MKNSDFKNEKSVAVRTAAAIASVEQITDQAVLGEIIKTNGDFYVCEAALNNLTDPAILTEIAASHPFPGIRMLADKKLSQSTAAPPEPVVAQQNRPVFEPVRQSYGEERPANTPPGVKRRHGCLTTWLILVIIGSAFSLIGNLLLLMKDSDRLTPLLIMMFLGLANIALAILLLKWKKIGLFGLVLTTIIVFIINLSIGTDVFLSIGGLVGIAILTGLLNMKVDGVSGWDNLE